MENVDLENKMFSVVEQLPFGLPAGTTYVEDMAPVKSSERTLPITDATLPAQYVDVRLGRKRFLLDTYHKQTLNDKA